MFARHEMTAAEIDTYTVTPVHGFTFTIVYDRSDQNHGQRPTERELLASLGHLEREPYDAAAEPSPSPLPPSERAWSFVLPHRFDPVRRRLAPRRDRSLASPPPA